MAKGDIELVRGWNLLTQAPATGGIVFQTKRGLDLKFQPSVGNVQPADTSGALECPPGKGERGTLAEIFLDAPDADHLWVYAPFGGLVSVRHA
ncbi:hypothetical protein TRP8649_01414 [Pelagimonas phthalicica]|uniref:Uncharacterized protein n=1 Tax=Pelagimonas phthalicica TaxID=1037362 RepID=A0A238J9B2_9RHOB|nr:hypothetical protein [Pelagimonas phthalicica]TDS94164.1 hypothetical protein CLV87_0658 [Pelagimonas phthalicica]SMX27311.1 hypothetical protein TRP8649_01414 [Pelagimonas phthalicica]